MPDIFGTYDEDENGEDENEVIFSIIQMVPADPNWRALFGEREHSASLKAVPLACFALVEITEEGEDAHRAIRPMIANELGIVDDVEAFPDFICLVPPGVEARVAMDNAETLRREAEAEEGEAEA
jgi:hypothetical protein